MMVAGWAAVAGVYFSKKTKKKVGEAITQVQVRVEIEGRDPGQLSRLYLDTGHGWDLFFGWIG